MSHDPDVDVHDLTSAMGNNKPFGAANTMIDLANCFASSSLTDSGTPGGTFDKDTGAAQNTNGKQWPCDNVWNGEYPMDATDNERLLILASMDDWRLPANNSTAIATDSYEPHVELPSTSPKFGTSPDLPQRHTSSSILSDAQKFRNKVEQRNGWMLNHTFHDLASMSLPTDHHELAELNNYMADEIWNRYTTHGIWPVFSPKSHPFYPCWTEHHIFNCVLRTIKDNENLGAVLCGRVPCAGGVLMERPLEEFVEDGVDEGVCDMDGDPMDQGI